MISTALALSAAVAVYESLLTPLNAPTDARATTRGVDAIGLDPAATVEADGFELQYRHRIVRAEQSVGRIGAYVNVPFESFALSAGYEWLNIPRARFQRGIFGVSAQVLRYLSVGVSYSGFSSRHKQLSGGIWSIGLFSELTSWLSLSLGVDGINSPRLLGGKLKPDIVLGVGVRPWLGAPWLSVGAEARFAAGGNSRYSLRLPRAVISAAPIEGLHLIAAYGRIADDFPTLARYVPATGHQVWFGLSAALGGLEARAIALGLHDGGEGGSAFADAQFAVTARQQPKESILRASGRTIEMHLEGELEHRTDGLLDLGYELPIAAIALDALADDPYISGVTLSLGKLDVGLATVEELRSAIKRLRKTGKRVVARLTTADDKTYMVAAACDSIAMDPVGRLRIDGFAVAQRFLAEGLGKIGIRFDAVGIGKYKSGPDPLTRSSARPEEHEVQDAILEQALSGLERVLAVDRGFSEKDIDAILARGMFSGPEAKELGLVDELTAPVDPKQLPPLVAPGEPWESTERPSRRWSQLPIIAVVPIRGTIVARASDNPLPGDSAEAGTIIPALDAARFDPDVVAVVLRIDSPGGDVLASDMIWRTVRVLAEVKPVVVSMGDTAASGGYYAAAPATKIFADPSTITGSIGIWTIKADLSGLFDLVGIKTETFKKGEHADWNHMSHALRPADRERLQHSMQQYYDTFVRKVAAGRNLTEERVREIAQGRIYTGAQAKVLGLVDELGGLADAVREARRLAHVEDQEIELDLPRRRRTVYNLALHLLGMQSVGPPSLLDLWEDLSRRVKRWDGSILALSPVYYDVSDTVQP